MKIYYKELPKVFICIGSNEVIGDCLGPLVGSYLKERFNNIEVYGDILNPVNFKNANDILAKIKVKYDNRCCVILVDSALGDEVGNLVITSGEMYIGKCLNKNRKLTGDINIKGIVGINHNNTIQNLLELKKIDFRKVNQMALNIVEISKKMNV